MVTIKDIAKHLNISKSSVSRAINNDPNINPETKEKVLEACRQLNYIPNMSARSLIQKEGRIVGLMIPDISDSFFSVSAYGVEEVMKANKKEVFYYSTSRDPQQVRQFLISAMEHRFSGVFITPNVWDKKLIEMLSKISIPVVSLRRKPPPGVDIPFVDANHFQGAYDAVTHLYDLGHRKIGFIKLDTVVGAERESGYQAAIHKYGLEPVTEKSGVSMGRSTDLPAGKTAAQNLLERRPDLTAIFAANDSLAIGVLSYMAEKGVHCPDDISVIGFDNLDITNLHWIKLTTIEQPRKDIGLKAAKMLLSMIQNYECRPEPIILDTVLVTRKSTGLVKERSPYF